MGHLSAADSAAESVGMASVAAGLMVIPCRELLMQSGRGRTMMLTTAGSCLGRGRARRGKMVVWQCTVPSGLAMLCMVMPASHR